MDLEKFNEQKNNLAKIGNELSNIGFNYKIRDKNKPEYWDDYIEKFTRHHEKEMQYYAQVYLLIDMVEKDKAEKFLLEIDNMKQLATRLLELLEEIKRNPSIVSPKDRQKSKWSKEIREQTIEYSNKNLEHEKKMYSIFHEFCEAHKIIH